ncbi:hypothetical protein SDC9_130004 [bioreactor metagenome]|uniref:Uncharacterized protein n=1 Tax=bioreactor metagenome TaxID=1076179 RepID=A0A645D2H9_9ZZZZ
MSSDVTDATSAAVPRRETGNCVVSTVTVFPAGTFSHANFTALTVDEAMSLNLTVIVARVVPLRFSQPAGTAIVYRYVVGPEKSARSKSSSVMESMSFKSSAAPETMTLAGVMVYSRLPTLAPSASMKFTFRGSSFSTFTGSVTWIWSAVA